MSAPPNSCFVSHHVSSSGSKANHPCCWPPYNRRWCNWSCWSSACGLAGGGARGETGYGSCQPQTVHLLKTDAVHHEKNEGTATQAHTTTLNRWTGHTDNFDLCSGWQIMLGPQHLPGFSEWSIWAMVIRCLFISSWKETWEWLKSEVWCDSQRTGERRASEKGKYLSEFISHEEGGGIRFWLHVSHMWRSGRVDMVGRKHLWWKQKRQVPITEKSKPAFDRLQHKEMWWNTEQLSFEMWEFFS